MDKKPSEKRIRPRVNFACPPALAELIEMVNLIGPERSDRWVYDSRFRDAFPPTLKEWLAKELPDEWKGGIHGNSRLYFLHQCEQAIRKIARINREQMTKDDALDETTKRRLLAEVYAAEPNHLIETVFDDAGCAHPHPKAMASILYGPQIGRIRECVYCRAVYWAVRKDQRCCSTEHSHLTRSNEHYWKQVGEERRQLYYQARKRRRSQKGE